MNATLNLCRPLSWLPAVAIWLAFAGIGEAQVDLQRPWAFLSNKPDLTEAPSGVPQINLRPNATEALFLYVVQPGAETPTLKIQVLAGNKSIADYSGPIDAKKFQRVKLKHVAQTTPPAAPAAADGKPIPADAGVSLPFVPTSRISPGHLQLIISTQEVNVPNAKANAAQQAFIIDDPAEILSKAEVKVIGGAEKKLEVNLEAKDLRGAPLDVKMSFATDDPKDLDITGYSSQLEGKLSAENPKLELFARNFKTSGSAKGQVILKLDKVDRAVVFNGVFEVQADGTRIFDRLSTSAVTIDVNKRFAKPGDEVIATINTTKMPADAVMNFQVRHRGGQERGQQETRLTSCQYEAKAKADDNTGALDITSKRLPWEIKLNTAGVTGPCALSVRLLENEAEVGSNTARVVFDASAPRITEFRFPPEVKQQVVKGRSIILEVAGRDPESEVVKVEFFPTFDPPAADAKDNAVKPIAGIAVPNAPGTWRAKLNLPDKPGQFTASVRLTNGVGMVSEVRRLTMTVLDIPLGSIKGQVSFDGKAQQSGVDVWLLNEKLEALKGPIKADKTGTYEFTNVKPGIYRIAVQQKVSGRARVGTTEVTVPEGDQATEANIKLKVK